MILLFLLVINIRGCVASTLSPTIQNVSCFGDWTPISVPNSLIQFCSNCSGTIVLYRTLDTDQSCAIYALNTSNYFRINDCRFPCLRNGLNLTELVDEIKQGLIGNNYLADL